VEEEVEVVDVEEQLLLLVVVVELEEHPEEWYL
jgi:hypothetical protein